MQLSEADPFFASRSGGQSPAGYLAGVCSLGLHAAMLAWLLSSSGDARTGAMPTATDETPIYVTLVAEASVKEPPRPSPVTEPVAASADSAPREDADAVEHLPSRPQLSREPSRTSKLTQVSPPARPPHPARSAPPNAEARAAKPQPGPLPTDDSRNATTKPAPNGYAEPKLFDRPATYPGYLANPVPDYPRGELRRGREGVVELNVKVSPSGRPERISISKTSGIGAFDEAAIRAVRRWRFLPATRAGSPVAGWVKVPIRFTLRRH